jgi:hypothetical protein
MALPVSVGAWNVVRELGRGGQGTVYLVRSAERQAQRQLYLDAIRIALMSGPAFDSKEKPLLIAKSLAGPLPDRLGRLREAALRRPGPSPRLCGALHPSRSDRQ